MMTSLVRRIRSIEQVRAVKRNYKKTAAFLSRILTREPRHILYAPRQALLKTTSPGKTGHSATETFRQLAAEQIGDMFFVEDVLYHPWQLGKKTEHAGGLIDEKTKSLVVPAIHYKSGYDQELPDADLGLLAKTSLPVIVHPVLYAGVLYSHFGHFLLESLGRLWAYAAVKHLDPYILFHVHGYEPRYLDKKNVVHQVFAGFNIPIEKVLFIYVPVRLRQVLVPVQKYGYGLCRNPDAKFMHFVRSFKWLEAVPPGFEGARLVYVSRARLPDSSARIMGEQFFEAYLGMNGYHIFYPEKHSLNQQLSVYRQAERIIFSDGGALHGCVLMPDLKAEVAVIARRRDPRWDSREILDQFFGYGIKTCWIDTIVAQYQLGMESWDAVTRIDWHEASKQLLAAGFADHLMEKPDPAVESLMIRKELKSYIHAIGDDEKFIDFMMKLSEQNASFPT